MPALPVVDDALRLLAAGDERAAATAIWRWLTATGASSGWDDRLGRQVAELDRVLRGEEHGELVLNVLLELRPLLVEAADPAALARVSEWMARALRAEGRADAADALERQARQLRLT